MDPSALVKRPNEVEWFQSTKTPRWEYAKLSGGGRPPKGVFGGPFTLWMRCGASVAYQPWISDSLTEYVIINGDLSVNGASVQAGEYACIFPNNDGFLSSERGMQGICVLHGESVWGLEVIKTFAAQTLSAEDALRLMEEPWNGHLKRLATQLDSGSPSTPEWMGRWVTMLHEWQPSALASLRMALKSLKSTEWMAKASAELKQLASSIVD